jgi:hypothetical protein
VRCTGFHRTQIALSRAAAGHPARDAGVAWSSGEFRLYSTVIGFGVATLFATALLFLMQVLEDFRDA